MRSRHANEKRVAVWVKWTFQEILEGRVDTSGKVNIESNSILELLSQKQDVILSSHTLPLHLLCIKN